MYLEKFNNKEKEMFLDLSVYAAQANGIVDDAEKELIMQYCKEMSVTFYDISKIHTFAEVVEFFGNVSKEKKKITLFELIGLCGVDGEVDTVEEAFARKFAKDIGLKDEVYDILARDIVEYSTILSIISGHVLNN